jgi:excisionase family DNA binding protein
MTMPEAVITGDRDPSERYLLTAEVAPILHVNKKTVSRWAKEGRLPFVRTLGGHRRYPEKRIRAIADGLRQEATEGPLVGGGR